MHNYDNNYIHALLVSDFKDETIVATMEEFFADMEAKGHTSRLNVTDNQAVRLLKKFLKSKEYK